MAHEFQIVDTSGTLTTYTDYNSIPLNTIAEVIKFVPDLGTRVDNREILLETATFNSTATDILIGVDGTLDSDELPTEFYVVLDGTDGSSTNAGDNILFEDVDSPDRLVPEQFTDGVGMTDDISVASFVRVSASVPDNDVRDVKFNNDGTKVFVLGRDNDNVYEYSVATAWNVSSITLVRTLDISVVSSTQGDNAANSIEFNTDGTKLFVLGQGQDNVDEYALSTGFDLSTASFTRSLDISGQEDQPYGIAFNNDGTKMFITGRRGDDVNEYILTTGFDISTASYSQKFSIDQGNGRPSAVQFNSDGTKMFILEGGTTAEGDNTIFQYTLTTAFDVSTASYSDKSFSPYNEEEKPRGFCFGDNETQLYVAGWRGDDINQYTSPWPKRATDALDMDGDGETDIRSTDGLENHLLLEDHDVIILESSTQNIDEVVFPDVLVSEQSGTGDDRIGFIVERDVPPTNHSHGPAGEPYVGNENDSRKNTYASVSEIRDADLWVYRLDLLVQRGISNVG